MAALIVLELDDIANLRWLAGKLLPCLLALLFMNREPALVFIDLQLLIALLCLLYSYQLAAQSSYCLQGSTSLLLDSSISR